MNEAESTKICPGCGEPLNSSGTKKHHNPSCRLKAFQIRKVENMFSIMKEICIAKIRKEGFRF